VELECFYCGKKMGYWQSRYKCPYCGAIFPRDTGGPIQRTIFAITPLIFALVALAIFIFKSCSDQ
jgi:transposase-like protein